MIELNIGDTIRQLRKEKGYKLKELSMKSNISTKTLAGIEGDISNSTVETVYYIATALDMPLSEFFKRCEDSTIREYEIPPKGPYNKDLVEITKCGQVRVFRYDDNKTILASNDAEHKGLIRVFSLAGYKIKEVRA